MWFWGPRAVEVVPASRGSIAEIVYATGVVEPVTWSKIASLVQARIIELCGCEGDPIEAGAVLARLDAQAAGAELAQLLARQAYLLRELARLRELAGRSVATQADLDRAESEEAQIEAAIAAQRARLDTYVLRAPISGTVLRQEGEVGEIASAGEIMFWVGQERPLRVVADINEEDIPRIEPGQHALLASDAFPGRPLDATVERVTPMGDPVARSYRVRFRLPDDTPLRIGMTVEVNVVVREKADALLVPAGAIDSADAIWVAEGGRAHRVEVRLGIRGAGEAEVVGGLDDGAAVIVPAPPDLAEGARIEPTEAER